MILSQKLQESVIYAIQDVAYLESVKQLADITEFFQKNNLYINIVYYLKEYKDIDLTKQIVENTDSIQLTKLDENDLQ